MVGVKVFVLSFYFDGLSSRVWGDGIVFLQGVRLASVGWVNPLVVCFAFIFIRKYLTALSFFCFLLGCTGMRETQDVGYPLR